MRTLYVSYFGLREPLVHTQVLPYLRELVSDGADVSLLTFEPGMRRAWSVALREEWTSHLGSEGIRWFALPYHKSPSLPATLYDVAIGAWTVARLVRRLKIDVIHARNHVPCVMGAAVKWLTGVRLLFDIRGFMAEEYVDAGTWPAGGSLFHLVKSVERRLLEASDGFVVLTERAREILFPDCSDTDPRGRPIEVIPCCVDLRRFVPPSSTHRETTRATLGLTGRRVIAYVGSLSGWYMTGEMAEFLAEAIRQDPSTFALILTQSPAKGIGEPLRKLGVAETDFVIRKVPPDEVPSYLGALDLALSFIRPSYSKLSSSPTKIAEYLASGLPVISSAGVGDLDSVIEGDRVGILVREFNREGYHRALEAVENLRREVGLSDRCLATARDRFDLEGVGGARYRRLYQRINESRSNAPLMGTTR